VTDFFYRDTVNARTFGFSTNRAAWYDFVRFLTNEHSIPGIGPGWSLVEADDAGTIRSVASTLGGLPTSNRWNPANIPGQIPPVGSWCVLETLNSNNTNHCQVFIQFNSDTRTDIRLIPLQNYVPAPGASTSGAVPTMPATNFGATQGTSLQWTLTGSCRYVGHATEGHFTIMGTDQQNWRYTYAGEVDDPQDTAKGASPADERAYVLMRLPDQPFAQYLSTNEPWIRLSPVNSTTVIGAGTNESNFAQPVINNGSGSNLTQLVSNAGLNNHPRATIKGLDVAVPLGVAFEASGHRHLAGWCRGLRFVHSFLGRGGTSGNRNWLFFNGSAISATPQGGVAMAWDGTTRYP